MYHVSAQGVDERMINVHYYYYIKGFRGEIPRVHKSESPLPKVSIDQSFLLLLLLLPGTGQNLHILHLSRQASSDTGQRSWVPNGESDLACGLKNFCFLLTQPSRMKYEHVTHFFFFLFLFSRLVKS